MNEHNSPKALVGEQPAGPSKGKAWHAPGNLKPWHPPVISRIEIAKTLSGGDAGHSDNDTTPHS